MIFKRYCRKCKWKTHLIPLSQSTLVAFEASGTAIILGLHYPSEFTLSWILSLTHPLVVSQEMVYTRQIVS